MEAKHMETIGMDIHRKQCQATVLDEQGHVLEEKRIATTTEALMAFFERHKDARMAIESTGNWEHVLNVGRQCGLDVVLANPYKTRLIAEAKIKTDRVDSLILARLMNADMLPECYVPDDETRETRKDVRERILMKKMSTALKNHIYSELLRRGIEYKDGILGSKTGRKWAKETLAEPRLEQTFMLLETVEGSIAEYNKERLLPAFEKNEKAQLVSTMPGIGYYSALTIVAELGDINRFSDTDKVVSYCGLNPTVHQSADHERHGSITKTGPTSLRWILVEAAHGHLLHCKDKENCKLCQFYKRVSKRRGKNIAFVAMAAKMIRIIYWMLKLNQPYSSQGLKPTDGMPENGDRLTGLNP
jgi:transposase